MSDIVLELTDGFQERLTFDIADRTADFDDRNAGFVRCEITVETALDLIGDMWDNLYRSSAEISAAFFLQNGPVNLTGCDIGIFRQTLIDKTLIMSKVQVCLGTVVGYEYLTMLDRIHRSRVDIDIRIEFLHRYFVATRFQKSSEGCGCDTFSQSGNNTSCYKYIFYCHNFLRSVHKTRIFFDQILSS